MVGRQGGATWAIVPVKSLTSGKSRLASVLTEAQRAELITRLLVRTTRQLQATPAVDEIVVVSHDERLQVLAATGLAVWTAAEPAGAGLNAAVDVGYALARAQGAGQVLVLPADLPFVDEYDIQEMLRPAGLNGGYPLKIAICSDESQQGTNALCFAGPLPAHFDFQFGPESFSRHLAAARALPASVQIVTTPGLRFDLDTAADWGQYVARREVRLQA